MSNPVNKLVTKLAVGQKVDSALEQHLRDMQDEVWAKYQDQLTLELILALQAKGVDAHLDNVKDWAKRLTRLDVGWEGLVSYFLDWADGVEAKDQNGFLLHKNEKMSTEYDQDTRTLSVKVG